jgi:hypothetical protein
VKCVAAGEEQELILKMMTGESEQAVNEAKIH